MLAEASMRAAMLPELLENFGIADVPPVVVKGISVDSRKLGEEFAFVALKGEASNGRDFIGQAIASRASVILMDSDDGAWAGKIDTPALVIPGLRCLLGRIAARFYGHPSHGALVLGVTGTNGKTTVAWLLTEALEAIGKKPALIGTLGAGPVDQLSATGFTTPEPVELQRLLRELRDEGFNAVCMEVSSHGIDQCRVEGVEFDGAVYTNLSRDHLDYHGDMGKYAAVKSRFFSSEDLSFTVLNRDDDYVDTMRSRISKNVRVIEYGLSQGDIHVLEELPSPTGLQLLLSTPTGECRINTRLIGRFNIYNLLAVVATLVGLDVALSDIESLAPELYSAPGRMEVFGGESSPLIVVDYAHTPDALKQVLIAVREHTQGRLWCVFGCGGDRDKGKRPIMGVMAEKYADVVVVTDDNPRGEDSQVIAADIVAGMKQQPKIIQDRRLAIEWVVSQAESPDSVVIAGKGHESVQLVGDRSLPFSDQLVVTELLGRAA